MENGRINGRKVSDETGRREKKSVWEKTRRGMSRMVEMKRKGAEGGCVDRKLIVTLFVVFSLPPCSNRVKAEG